MRNFIRWWSCLEDTLTSTLLPAFASIPGAMRSNALCHLGGFKKRHRPIHSTITMARDMNTRSLYLPIVRLRGLPEVVRFIASGPRLDLHFNYYCANYFHNLPLFLSPFTSLSYCGLLFNATELKIRHTSHLVVDPLFPECLFSALLCLRTGSAILLRTTSPNSQVIEIVCTRILGYATLTESGDALIIRPFEPIGHSRVQ